MGIRETINEKPAIAYGGFGVLLLLAIALGVYLMRGGPGPAPIDKPVGDQVFYTVDDGKTWFPDALQKATPFKHEGKDAVRAMVYRCSDGKSFTAFLVRHTDLGRQQKGLALEIANRPSFSDHPYTEAKKPGEKDWLPVDAKNINKVMDVMSATCSGNVNDVPQLLFPGQ